MSGIIAGNGHDSNGAYQGVAPESKIISLKVLDGARQRRISHVIAALD